jgi:AcrR family transcriptional regulator
MASQAERRAATRAAILETGRRLFGRDGFAATSMDRIAAEAGVAKGAVYHHFATKEAVFEAVFEAVSEDLARDVAKASRGSVDALAAMVAGTRAYFALCSEEATGQIILRDGPAALGWEKWRATDVKHFGGMIPKGLEAAMKAGLMPRQPTEPLARLLLGAVTEAAMACAGQKDIRKAGQAYVKAFASLLEALRTKG